MRFDKVTRYTYQPTNRKSAAILRKQQRERDALPLFAHLVAAEQKPVDEVHALRASAAVRSEAESRARQADQWRRARRELRALDPDVQAMILRRWNLARYPWPGTGLCLLCILHMVRSGRFDLTQTQALYPDRATRDAAEADRLALIGHR